MNFDVLYYQVSYGRFGGLKQREGGLLTTAGVGMLCKWLLGVAMVGCFGSGWISDYFFL